MRQIGTIFHSQMQQASIHSKRLCLKVFTCTIKKIRDKRRLEKTYKQDSVRAHNNIILFLFWNQLYKTTEHRTTSSCIILYHLVKSCIILYHLVSSCIIMYHLVSSCIILYHLVSSCFILYHHVSSCIILYHLVSSCIILYHLVSSCIILYHLVSSCFLFNLTCRSLAKSAQLWTEPGGWGWGVGGSWACLIIL